MGIIILVVIVLIVGCRKQWWSTLEEKHQPSTDGKIAAKEAQFNEMWDSHFPRN